MNITKQQWTIIGVIVAVIAVWYFFLRKKKSESSFSRITSGTSIDEHCCVRDYTGGCGCGSINGKCDHCGNA